MPSHPLPEPGGPPPPGPLLRAGPGCGAGTPSAGWSCGAAVRDEALAVLRQQAATRLHAALARRAQIVRGHRDPVATRTLTRPDESPVHPPRWLVQDEQPSKLVAC